MSAERCPSCGQLNSCAQQDSDAPVSHCWCFDVQIEPARLEQLPEQQRNQACLCPRCAQALPADNS